MKLTFLGHACFSVEVAGSRLLFDPFINGNPRATHLDVDQIEADYVLLTHGHGDHVADAESILRRTGARLVSSYEIVSWYGEKGITNGHPMNLGGSYRTPFGRVKYVTAVHSSVLPDGTYGGNPGGFVVESAEGTFYVSGDTVWYEGVEDVAVC